MEGSIFRTITVAWMFTHLRRSCLALLDTARGGLRCADSAGYNCARSGSSSVAERQLPKLNVAGSIPVSRSISPATPYRSDLLKTTISMRLRLAIVGSGTDHQHGHGVLVLYLPSR